MGIIESLLNAEWVEYQAMNNTFAFAMWTLEMLLIGAGAGFVAGLTRGKRRTDHKADVTKFHDLTRRQRSILATLRKEQAEYVCDADVMGLVSMGLIAESRGYNASPGSTYTFSITAKGNRMMRFHPIGRWTASRR